jgi:hypothetical protein
MDKETKNLLINAMEECGKIVHYCGKSIKYGLFGHHPNKSKTNGDEILIKYYKLQAMIETLQRNHVLPVYSRDYINHIKRDALNGVKSVKRNKNIK